MSEDDNLAGEVRVLSWDVRRLLDVIQLKVVPAITRIDEQLAFLEEDNAELHRRTADLEAEVEQLRAAAGGR